MQPSVQVELWRGSKLESLHMVDIVVASVDGPTTAWGDQKRSVMPRSAIKIVQALPLLTSGAAEAYGLTDQQLALGCASHSGSTDHTEAVRQWLHDLGLGEHNLQCGAARPLGVPEAQALDRRGDSPQAVHNCCSGKHAAFLTIAQHLGHPTTGYIEPDHPTQQLITQSVADLTGESLSDAPSGVDGCGIPAFALSLAALAKAMAHVANPASLSDSTAAAARRLAKALPGNEFWLSGADRMEVQIAAVAIEPILAKVGAEGVFLAALPERGLGIALKARDGAVRAGDHAIGAVLHHLGATRSLVPDSAIANAAGRPVGEYCVSGLSVG